MGNYPTKRSEIEGGKGSVFDQTYGSMTDEHAMWYSHKDGQEISLDRGSMQICKIYSMNHEMFFFDKEGKKKMLSEGGKIKPEAKELVKQAKGYGNPMIWITGSLTEPRYCSMITDERTDRWEMVTYNSWKGFQGAVTGLRRSAMDQKVYHRQHLGDMSINVFEQHRATTMFLDGRKITKAIDGAFQGTVSSLLEMCLDTVTLGLASPLMELTGLSAAIDKVGSDYYEKAFGSTKGGVADKFKIWLQDKEGAKAQDESHNKIIDERLPLAIDSMLKLSKQYGVDEKFGVQGLDYHNFSPRSKVSYFRQLTHKVTTEAVHKELDEFKHNLVITKKVAPDLDTSMFDLGERMTPEQRLVQLSQYKATFQKEIMPTLTNIYEERKGLKVQPEIESPNEPEGSVTEEKVSPKPDKTVVNKKMSNKTVSGESKKGSWRVRLTVNG